MSKRMSLRSCVAVVLIVVLIPIYIITLYISFDSKKEELNYYEKAAVEASIQGTVAQINATEKVYGFIANRYEKEMKNTAKKFLAKIEVSNEPYDEINLEEYKKNGSNYFDYYIINKNNVIINSTSPGIIGLGFKEGEEFSGALNKIRLSGKLEISKITLERKTGKLRKWAYIPTKDKQYLLEIGLKSEEVEKYLKPIDFSELNKIIVEENPMIRKISVYNDQLRDLATKEIVTDLQEKKIIKEVFDSKKTKEIYDDDGFLAKKYKLINNSNKIIDDGARVVVAEYDNTRAIKLLEELRLDAIAVFCISILILLVSVGYFVNKYIVKPITKLENGVNEFTADVFTENYSGISTDKLESEEAKSLAKSFNLMVYRLKTSLVSKDYLENVIDSVGDIIIITDKNLKIKSVNKYLQNALGMSQKEILEHEFCAFFKEIEQIRTRINKLKEKDFENLVDELELTLILGNKELPVIAKIISYRNKNGELEGFICSARDITKLQETVELMQKKADALFKVSQHDSLTNCLNRRGLIRPLEKAFKKAENGIDSFSVIMLDIDDFKIINDTYGHPEGDEVLAKVAKIMKESCRKDDAVVRFGGEEFLILLPGTKLWTATAIGEKIRLKIEETLFKGETFGVTISGGVAEWNYKDRDTEDIIKRADGLLYKAKANGKNQINY